MVKLHMLALCCVLFVLQSEVSIQVTWSVSIRQYCFVFLQVSSDEASQSSQVHYAADQSGQGMHKINYLFLTVLGFELTEW